MTGEGVPAGRSEIVDAYRRTTAAFATATVEAGLGGRRRRTAGAEAERLGVRLRDLAASYLALVAPRPVSRCPHTGRVLDFTVDDDGLDGAWWDHDQPVRPDQPWLDSCVAITGAVARRGSAPEVPWAVWPGPEAPYVVPDLLGRTDVLAVVSSLTLVEDTGYVIAYFAPPPVAIDPGVNAWGANWYGFTDAEGARRWGTAPEPAVVRDFELAPWVERGKLAWILPGDTSLTLRREVDGCPFLDLPGDRSLVSIRAGRVTRVDDLTRSQPAMPPPQGATLMSSSAAIPPQPALVPRRRRWGFGWLGTVAGLLALAATLGGLALALSNPQAHGFGTVSVEEGAAQVRTDAGETFRDVQPGEGIALGAALRTDDAGFVTLTLDDGSILRLGPGTALAFEQTDNNGRVIRIVDGSAWYRATPNEGADPIAVATDGAFLEGDRVAVAVECAQEATCAIQPLEGALTAATTSGERVPLAPGEELTVDDAGGVSEVILVENPEADAWVARNREADRAAGLGPVGASAVAPDVGSLAGAEMDGTWHFTTRVTESTSEVFDTGAEPVFDIELTNPCPEQGCDFGATLGRYAGTGKYGSDTVTFNVDGPITCTGVDSDQVTVPDAGTESLAFDLHPTAATRESGAWRATGVTGTAAYEQTVDIACNEADQLGTFHASFEVTGEPLDGGTEGSPAPEPPATPEPSAAAASYEFLGWSIETAAIESQNDPSVPPPADLIPSGGTISICGGERLVYWVRYVNAPTEQVVLGSFVGPNVGIQPVPGRYPSGNGTMTFWWGYTDGPLDERDAGQYQSEVSVDGTDTVVATGEVTAIC